jgi:uncharacterized protein (TIGR03382 family)
MMKTTLLPGFALTFLALLSSNAQATVAVPEIDGHGAALAVGLAVGLVALIRERRRGR